MPSRVEARKIRIKEAAPPSHCELTSSQLIETLWSENWETLPAREMKNVSRRNPKSSMIPPAGKLTNYPRHPLGNRAKRDPNKKKVGHYDQQQKQQHLNCKKKRQQKEEQVTQLCRRPSPLGPGRENGQTRKRPQHGARCPVLAFSNKKVMHNLLLLQCSALWLTIWSATQFSHRDVAEKKKIYNTN